MKTFISFLFILGFALFAYQSFYYSRLDVLIVPLVILLPGCLIVLIHFGGSGLTFGGSSGGGFGGGFGGGGFGGGFGGGGGGGFGGAGAGGGW